MNTQPQLQTAWTINRDVIPLKQVHLLDRAHQIPMRQANLSAFPLALMIFGAILAIWFLNSFLKICNPNEILILSGRKHRTKSGQEVGYRVIFGGRVIVIPILETVKRMDLTTMPVFGGSQECLL